MRRWGDGNPRQTDQRTAIHLNTKLTPSEYWALGVTRATREAVALAGGEPADQVRLRELRLAAGLPLDPEGARSSGSIYMTQDQVREWEGLDPVPKSVAILGLGPSLEAYADLTKQIGGRRAMFDEVWGINSAIDVFNCDRGFHMDDVRVQEIRAAARPDSNIAKMLPWLRKHPGPIYTSVPHENYPGLIAYPLADVMNSCGRAAYFNGTAAYAVALAVHFGIEKIYLFGIDFTLPDYHRAEQGRACVEFYLGMHKARGGVIGLPPGTSLMDGIATNDGRLYGYDGMAVSFEGEDNEPLRLTFTPRDLPSAEEIERRYDSSRHPNPLLRSDAGG